MQYIDERNMQNLKKTDASSWETLKENVFVRLINKKYLKEYGDVAYTTLLDLAMVFSVQEKTKAGIMTHLLTNDELKTLGVEVDEVKTTAMTNTGNDRKRRIMTFKESTLKNNVMYPVLQIPKGMMMGAGDHSMADCGIIQDVDEEKQCDNILMLCNKYDCFGSSYMVVPSVLDEVYERFNNENFYIIPLSVHQVMCVRSGYASHEGDKPHYEVEDDLLDMIESFNDSNNKSWKDVLSYKIYYYFGDDGKKLFLIK